MGKSTPEYQRNHRLVKKVRGKANEYQCLLCFDRATEWVHLWRTHPDPSDPWSYDAMCSQDHRDYDRGRYNTPEFKARMSELMRERRNTPEFNQKLSEATRNRDRSTESKDHYQDPEYRAKLSEALTRAWERRRGQQAR